jgi:hypothetical protein
MDLHDHSTNSFMVFSVSLWLVSDLPECVWQGGRSGDLT